MEGAYIFRNAVSEPGRPACAEFMDESALFGSCAATAPTLFIVPVTNAEINEQRKGTVVRAAAAATPISADRLIASNKSWGNTEGPAVD